MALTDHRVLARSHLRMRHLSIILALCRHGSMRRAADDLGLSQPAITKALQEMEQLFGCSFFIRSARGIMPTPMGEAIARFATSMSTDLDMLDQELAQIGSGALGTLRVGGIMAAIGPVLAPAIVALTAEYPGIRVQIQVDTSDVLLSAMKDGELDLIIGRIPNGWAAAGLSFESLGTEDLSIVCSMDHPATEEECRSVAGLSRYPWILQPAPSPMRRVVEHLFSESGMALPYTIIETSSTLMTLGLLRESVMIAVMPTSVASTHVQAGLIRMMSPSLIGRLGPYGLLVREGRPVGKPAALLIAAIRHVVDETIVRPASCP